MAKFCSNCGQQVADELKFCPNCGSPVDGQTQPTQQAQPQFNPNMGMNPNMYSTQNAFAGSKVDSQNQIAFILGIVGLVLGIVGGILFGLFCTLPALAMGIVSIIMAINVKKATNNAKGTGAMVCAILAIVFSSIFTVGCSACGCGELDGYGCYGCAGASCKAKNDINNAFDELDESDEFQDFLDMFD